MPNSTKQRILLILDQELVEKVDDFRYSNRIPSRTEAIRQLLETALEKKKSKK
jgi:metal-responsive CopG/Arc/MetJ family transcriptional regulator